MNNNDEYYNENEKTEELLKETDAAINEVDAELDDDKAENLSGGKKSGNPSTCDYYCHNCGKMEVYRRWFPTYICYDCSLKGIRSVMEAINCW